MTESDLSHTTKAQLVAELAQVRKDLARSTSKLVQVTEERDRAQADVSRLGLALEDQEAQAVTRARAETVELQGLLEEKQDTLERWGVRLDAALDQVKFLQEALAVIGRGSRFADHPKYARLTIEQFEQRHRGRES